MGNRGTLPGQGRPRCGVPPAQHPVPSRIPGAMTEDEDGATAAPPPPSGRGGRGPAKQQREADAWGGPGRRGAGRCSRPGPPRRWSASPCRGLALPARPDRAVGGGRGPGGAGSGAGWLPAAAALWGLLPATEGRRSPGNASAKPGPAAPKRREEKARVRQPCLPACLGRPPPRSWRGAPVPEPSRAQRRAIRPCQEPRSPRRSCGRGRSMATPGSQPAAARIGPGKGSRCQTAPRSAGRALAAGASLLETSTPTALLGLVLG